MSRRYRAHGVDLHFSVDDEPAEARRRVVLAFNKVHEEDLNPDGLSREDQSRVARWWRRFEMDEATAPLGFVSRRVLHEVVFSGLEDKINFLAHRVCTACRTTTAHTFAVRVPPLSRQSTNPST